MRTKWSILIASATVRHNQFNKLVDELERQRAGRTDIDILAIMDDCRVPLDAKRNMLVAMSDAEYVCFIDDDDQVAADYISTIYPLLDGVDYVGFQLQHYNKGVKAKPTYHSLQYKSWAEDEKGFYRDISHLNPIRRDIAKRFGFEGNYGEDHAWSRSVVESGLARTEHYIDRVMYHYFFDIDKSLTAGKK